MKRNANRHNRFLNFGLAAQAAILALVLLSVSFLPRVIFAATFTVAPDSEYQTIQSAIGASSNGDTVLVAPGVYRENVAFGGRIILKAENAAPGATVIEAVDPAVSAITAAGPAEINGFTIRGATNSAGIRLNYGAWEAKISNNIIESNLDGIYIVNYGSGNSEITRNIFRGNTGYDINLPMEYNSSAGVSTQSSGNIIYLNDFYGTLYPYQDYVNYWNPQEELGYKYQNKVYRGKPGNYQPQCQTEDPDGDGIGNAACPIGGYTDGFPLVQPFENYEIAESEIISGQQEWDQNKIIDNPVVINAGARLTIKKGVKITFQSNGSILVNGDLLAKGTVKNPIVFSGMNGYAGRIITVGESGKADFRNAEISTSAIDGGLPPRQTAVSVSGAGILEMQACNINGSAAGIELNRVNGGNIKINRSKFFNNIIDVANNDPTDAVLPDFKWNWWGDSKIIGNIDWSNRITDQDFRDPVIIVPGIAGSWPEYGVVGQLKIDPILHTYDNLYDEFIAVGYSPEIDLFTFPYEWRDSNIVTAKLLADKIQEIKNRTGKVDIVAHSMGGLVARQYIESADYQNDIDQLITLATPQNGAPIMYPMWEAGAFLKASVLDYLVEQYFKIEAAESGHFLDTFGYIRNRPVVSVQELLPVYNYLYDQDNNGELRQYPNNYPQNSFIENLNKSENIEKLRDVEFDKIIGNLESDFKTYTGFNLVSYDGDENVWQDGIPDGFPSQGTIKNVGDKIVPLESAKSDNIPSDEYFEINADHNGTPTEAQQDVLELLTGSRPQSEVRRSPIKDLLIVSVFSPVDVQVIAPDGAKIGKDFATGQIVNEIPDAYYTGYNTVSEFLTIPNPTDGEYKVLTQGTGSGNYAIKATKIVQNDQNTVATESTVTIQGITTLNQREQVDILLQGDEVKENSDNLSPRTTILINGQSPKGFYNVDAAIILSATDFSQTGVVPAGVDSIVYRLNGNAATTTIGATTTIMVSNQGKHALSYRAKDKLDNLEDEKTVKFVIDKTSPELKFGFDQTKKDLAFSATDNYTSSSTIAVIDQNGAVSATDQAGNETKLSFSEKNRKQSLRAQLSGLSYNGQAVDLSGSRLAFAWFYGYTPKLPLLLTGLQPLPAIPKTLPKPGSLSFLLQQAKLKDGSFIVALFGNNKTLLLEYKNRKLNLKTFSGLKLLNFATDKGKLSWSY